MYGKIAKIGEEITTIMTEENDVIEMNSLFMPVMFKTGDTVEIEDGKIVLR